MELIECVKTVKLSEIRQTCGACPTQFEGKTESGEYVYCRLRHGYMYMEIEDKVIFEAYPKHLDGVCSWDDFKRYAGMDNIVIDDGS